MHSQTYFFRFRFSPTLASPHLYRQHHFRPEEASRSIPIANINLADSIQHNTAISKQTTRLGTTFREPLLVISATPKFQPQRHFNTTPTQISHGTLQLLLSSKAHRVRRPSHQFQGRRGALRCLQEPENLLRLSCDNWNWSCPLEVGAVS